MVYVWPVDGSCADDPYAAGLWGVLVSVVCWDCSLKYLSLTCGVLIFLLIWKWCQHSEVASHFQGEVQKLCDLTDSIGLAGSPRARWCCPPRLRGRLFGARWLARSQPHLRAMLFSATAAVLGQSGATVATAGRLLTQCSWHLVSGGLVTATVVCDYMVFGIHRRSGLSFPRTGTAGRVFWRRNTTKTGCSSE